MIMRSLFRCCRADQHVAVQSTGASTKGHPKSLGGASDVRGFDDDKQAIAKWRQQHEQHLPHHEEEKKEIEEDVFSSSGAESSCHYSVDGNNRSVKISPRAVQAWQQKQQSAQEKDQPQQQLAEQEPSANVSGSHSLDGTTASLHSEPKPRPPRSKPPRTQPPVIRHVDDEIAIAALVTPEHAPSFDSSPARSHSSQLSKQSQVSRQSAINPPPHLQRKLSSNKKPTQSYDARLPLPHPSPTTNRRHDHEGPLDAIIRDAALSQPVSSRSNSTEGDHDRIEGDVFLQVNAHDAISPRSSVDENSMTGSYSYYDDTSVSDIFSDPLSEVPSFTDSATRERYILACRLLKARMLQKSPPPILPMERDLLQDLLNRFQSSKDAGSDVAFEALSNILRRENDPVVYSHSGSRDGDNEEEEEEEEEDETSDTWTEDGGKDEMVGLQGSPDHSIRKDGEGSNTVLKQNYHREEKSAKAIPSLVQEDQYRLPVEQPSSSMVRLDGWDAAVLKEQPPLFEILGLDKDTPPKTRVLTPALMEALRGFFPYAVSEDNFWLKFSLVRDGASIHCLLDKVNTSKHTVLCIETEDGGIFGSFCSAPWRIQQKRWFGTGESFLWKLKQSRYAQMEGSDERSHARVPNNEMEVYPFTGADDMVQYCTQTTLAVGGGSWNDTTCPYAKEPTGIGLLVDGDLEGGETNSCATFANPRLYGRATSTNEFNIRNLEVWTLTPCGTVQLADQLERQKYFLERNGK